MATFHGDYFDGRTSARRGVVVAVDAGVARIAGDGLAFELDAADLHVGSRVGNAPLRIALPDGGVIVAADADAVAGALEVPRVQGVAHRLETHPIAMAAAVAGIVVAGYFAYTLGIPRLAAYVAAQMPVSFEEDVAKEALEQLDRIVLRPSSLPEIRAARLREAFTRVARAANLPQARLEFRDGKWLGANAFALPGRTVVMTDRLAHLLEDDRIAAVFAHELGHLKHQHSTRQILQASALTLFSMALFGDVSAGAGLAATVPTIVMYTGYSRDFEREADQFAFELLPRVGLSPRLFGEALTALESRVERGRGDDDEGFGYLRTHPTARERIEAAEAAAKAAGF